MILPTRIDLNEWFALSAGLIGLTVVLFLPRRFPIAMSAITWAFNFFLAIVLDHFLAGPVYDMYDIFDSPKYELFDLFTYLVVYPPAAYTLVYLFDKWRLTGVQTVAYVLGWVLLTTCLEWLAAKSGIFHYKGWKIIYSFPTYTVIYLINIALLVKIKPLFAQKTGAPAK
jgi:VanZ family protein